MSMQSFIEQLDAARALASDIAALEKQMQEKKKRLEEIVGAGVIPAVTARSILHNAQQPVKQLPENMAHANLITKLIEALKINEGIPMSARELSELVGDKRLQSIHSMLVRQADKGVISKTGKGRYVWVRQQARA